MYMFCMIVCFAVILFGLFEVRHIYVFPTVPKKTEFLDKSSINIDI